MPNKYDNVPIAVPPCHLLNSPLMSTSSSLPPSPPRLTQRVAAMLDLAPITDVVEIKGEDTFVRPMYVCGKV